jgi:glutathione S-transferase
LIKLHHLNNSRSQRILWLLEELELPYEIIKYQRNKLTQLAPKSLKKIHPLGKAPILEDGESVMAESGAILEYLIKSYGNGKIYIPTNGKDFENYTYWMHYAEGSLMPPLVMKLVFEKIKSSPMPFFVKPIAKMIANTVLDTYVDKGVDGNFKFIEDFLSKNKWFAGSELTGADIQMSFPLEAGLDRINDNNLYPNITSFVSRIKELPTYQKAIQKGGTYIY